jgi:hypothetical protein
MDSNTVIMGTLGFVGLWVTYHFVWCAAVKTLFRQQLFRLRDALFLEAAKGKISFEDPAYGMLRIMMQRTLAASEDINTLQVLVAIVFARRSRGGSPPLAVKFAEVVESMHDRERAAIYQQFHESMMRLLAIHFVRTMPVPIIGTVLVAVLFRARGRIARRLLEHIQAKRRGSAATYVEAASHLPDDVQLA